MPVFNTKELIDDLVQDVQQTIDTAESLLSLTDISLLTQLREKSWCIAQVVEHLNIYNRFYLNEIDKALKVPSSVNPKFKSGLLGNYFVNMMQPKEEVVKNKMKTQSNFNPNADLDPRKVLKEFIDGQTKLLSLLNTSSNANLTKLKTPISISKIVKLRLGDTLRFLITHQVRHFIQIKNIESAIQLSKSA